MKNLIQGNKPPRADTCNECDKYKAEMKNFRRSNDRSEERLKAISDMKSKNKVHLRRSKVPHTWRKEYRKCTDPGVACITVDLQKTLPTPKINTCLQYYKRKLWTYNLCIHDVKTGHASMYLWDESIAKRGSVEIASCMLHYIENEIKPEVTKLVVFSDNCGGQNKNWTLMCMYLRQIHANRFTRVEHIFMVAGHSYLPCDRDFGHIDRFIRNKEMYNKDHYARSIRLARATKPFTVVKKTK